MIRPPRHVILPIVLLAGCATVKPPTSSALIPTQHQTRTGPYCVFTNAPLPADAPPIRHLQALERQIETTLGLRVPPGSDPIEIYILDNAESFRHFLTFYHPDLPTRRAFFLAQGTRRVVYAYQGERLDEDLRHEATHALLHAAAPDLPLWLDEGLAEYFEVDDDRSGRNAEHLARLPDDFAEGFHPDLKRLEALRDVRKMSPRDYRESWAWVHYLLNGPPRAKAALLADLADRRAGGSAPSLSKRLAILDPEMGSKLAAHVQVQRQAEEIAEKVGRDREPTVRFQDAATPEVSPRPSRRRSPIARFFGLLIPDRKTLPREDTP